MAQTLGLSEEAAEGFIRLTESLDKIDTAQNKMLRDNKSLTQSYYDAMTAGEAFNASLNKFKSSFSESIAVMTQYSTDFLKKAFQTSLDDIINLLPKGVGDKVKSAKDSVSEYLPDALNKNLGSTGMVVGAGALTALLAGGGLKGLMNLGAGKAKGFVEKAAYEQITGAKVQDVYVVNAGEIAGGGGGGGPMSPGAMGIFTKALGAFGVGAAGFGIGELINQGIEGTDFQKSIDGFFGDLGEKFGNKTGKPAERYFDPTKLTPPGGVMEKPQNPQINIVPPKAQTPMISNSGVRNDVNVRVTIDTKNKDLKATKSLQRGVAQ